MIVKIMTIIVPIIWFLFLNIWGSSDEKKKTWLAFVYPLIIIITQIIPFTDDPMGLMVEQYLFPLICSLLILILLLYCYRHDLSGLFIQRTRSSWLFFVPFFVPLIFFVSVKLFGQNLNENAKMSLAIYWTRFFFRFPLIFIEELYFRGFAINIMLKNGFRKWISILPSVIIFSLFHISQSESIIMQLLPVVGLSLLFSIVVLRTQKIRNSIFLHLLWNFSLYGLVTIIF